MQQEKEIDLAVIVLIEDEETLRRSLHFTLFRQGYSVIAVGTAAEAEEIVKKRMPLEERVGLVIIDVRAPGSSEIEQVEQIKRVTGAPVLAIAGRADREIRPALGRIGVHDVLSKPFDMVQLVSKVKTLVTTNTDS